MAQQYIYKLIREDWTTGVKAKRPRTIFRDKPNLKVGEMIVKKTTLTIKPPSQGKRS